MKISYKIVKELEECYEQPLYSFPKYLANSRDRETGKPCIVVGINTTSLKIPVETPTEVSNDFWQILREAGIMKDAVTMTERGVYKEFDPVRQSYVKGQ